MESLAKVNELIEAGKLNQAAALLQKELDEDFINQFLNNVISPINAEAKERLIYQCELLYLKIKLLTKEQQNTVASKALFIALTEKVLKIDPTIFNLSLEQKLSEIKS
ncbi:MAG: hypothetical protein E6Q95_05910 [Chitinophagaceae bacterium]|nr:MAG: hypothetical protein E6Q95_05910 [Chitinophagaceae bacterium]